MVDGDGFRDELRRSAGRPDGPLHQRRSSHPFRRRQAAGARTQAVTRPCRPPTPAGMRMQVSSPRAAMHLHVATCGSRRGGRPTGGVAGQPERRYPETAGRTRLFPALGAQQGRRSCALQCARIPGLAGALATTARAASTARKAAGSTAAARLSPLVRSGHLVAVTRIGVTQAPRWRSCCGCSSA